MSRHFRGSSRPQYPPRRSGPAERQASALPRSGPWAPVLRALQAEVKAQQDGGRRQFTALTKGTFVERLARKSVYTFQARDAITVADDAPIQLRIGQRLEPGSVVSVRGQNIWLATDRDLGNPVPDCQLEADESGMTKALLDRLIEVTRSTPPAAEWLPAIPSKLIEGSGFDEVRATALAAQPPSRGRPLNAKQLEAYTLALGNPVSLIWGPPGTGKTTTLAPIIQRLLASGSRVLVVSNTNRAVDGLLEKLCAQLADDPAFRDGAVQRRGVMSEISQRPFLGGCIGDYVVADQIVARLSAGLQGSRARLQGQAAALDDTLRAAEARVQVHDQREAAERLVAELVREIEGHRRMHASASVEASTLPGTIRAAAARLAEHQAKGLISKMFSGNTEAGLRREVQDGEGALHDAVRRSEAAANAQAHLAPRVAPARADAAALVAAVGSESRTVADRRLAEARERARAANAELAAIEAAIAGVAADVAARCRVVFATAHQTYLRPKEFSVFDAVILEEASMLLLPAALYVAGLAKGRLIVAGDFQQLPPIAASEGDDAGVWLRRDLFSLTGVEDHVRSRGQTAARAPFRMLEEQHRMDARICGLINDRFYGGKLRTVTEVERGAASNYPELVGDVLTVLDTSEQHPFAHLKARTWSRYNLLHVHVIRDACRRLIAGGIPAAEIAVVSPYAAQVQLLADALADEGVPVGTVHRFQGQEARVVIFDVPDSPGVPGRGGTAAVSRFMRAVRDDEDGAKLINVAVTRAKRRLVIVANVQHLEKYLPADAILREVIESIRVQGIVRAAPEPLGSAPAAGGLLPQPGDDARQFSEDVFEEAFSRDLLTARRSVVIFSAFAYPARTERWCDAVARASARGIRVHVFTRPPSDYKDREQALVRRALAALQTVGAIIDLRHAMHQKIAIIDDAVIWYGSLNILSYTPRTAETMLRWSSPAMAQRILQFESDRRKASAASGVGSGTGAENPTCPACGDLTSRSTDSRGKQLYTCIDDRCGWSGDWDGSTGAPPPPRAPPPPVRSCPRCGAKLERKYNRDTREPFLGCAAWPACSHTEGA